MANHSELSRKEQVLEYLAERANRWVDGPEIANEQVGGSEGLKRLRELRAEGHRIVTRAHPDPKRDIFQYKLVLPEERPDPPPPPPVTPGLAGREMPLYYDAKTGRYELASVRCPDCGQRYINEIEHRDEPEHQAWLAKREKIEHGQQRIPVDPQPPAFRYTKVPERIVVGETVFCPKCKGRRRKERIGKDGATIAAADFCIDPVRPIRNGQPNPCERCNGLGIVPVSQP